MTEDTKVVSLDPCIESKPPPTTEEKLANAKIGRENALSTANYLTGYIKGLEESLRDLQKEQEN